MISFFHLACAYLVLSFICALFATYIKQQNAPEIWPEPIGFFLGMYAAWPAAFLTMIILSLGSPKRLRDLFRDV